MMQTLCYECAAITRLAYPKKELRQDEEDRATLKPCGRCRKRRYTNQFELVDKERVDVKDAISGGTC